MHGTFFKNIGIAYADDVVLLRRSKINLKNLPELARKFGHQTKIKYMRKKKIEKDRNIKLKVKERE